MKLLTVIAILVALTGIAWLSLRPSVIPESSTHQQQAAQASKWLPLFDGSKDLPARLALARTHHTTFQIEEIFPHLKSLNPSQVPTSRMENDFLILNEIIEVHRRKEIALTQLSTFLQTLLKSPDLHPVIRDYAAQHLAVLAQFRPAFSEEILATLCSALQDSQIQQTTIPGTLFNGFNRLRLQSPELLDPFEHLITQSLTNLLKQSHLPIPVKVTLVQSLKNQTQSPQAKISAREVLRTLIQDRHTHEAVLIAAAASLGHIGLPEDLPILETLIARGTLATAAAQTSINKISQSL